MRPKTNDESKSQVRFPAFKNRLLSLVGSQHATEFADKVGISRQTVGFYLKGTRIPDAFTLTQICEKCHVSADWLLGLSETKDVDSNRLDISLKPCPFCGREARLYVNGEGVAVVCTGWLKNGCGCRTDVYVDWNEVHGLDSWRLGTVAVEKAVIAWNRRADGVHQS